MGAPPFRVPGQNRVAIGEPGPRARGASGGLRWIAPGLAGSVLHQRRRIKGCGMREVPRSYCHSASLPPFPFGPKQPPFNPQGLRSFPFPQPGRGILRGWPMARGPVNLAIAVPLRSWTGHD